MVKKTLLILLSFSVIVLSGCENQSAQDLLDEYASEAGEAAAEKAKEVAKDVASDAASNINEKIDSSEPASRVKQGVTTAGEYAQDAYDYVTDEDNINSAKEKAKSEQNKTKNFFDFMFGQAEDEWEGVKENLTKKTSEFTDEKKSLEDASEYDFYGDYTNPWLQAQGIDTSGQGTALDQFKVIIGQTSKEVKEKAKDIKQYHDERHPSQSTGTASSSDEATNNTYKTDALSNALLNAIPPYSGSPYVIVNDNVPFFEESELTTEPFIVLSELDSLGRVGVGYMNACSSLCPSEPRGSIGDIRPTGFVQAKYDVLKSEPDNPQGFLWCRCHTLMYALSGINNDPRGLLTGSFYFNVSGMETWEMETLRYVKSHPDAHVLYRCVPVYNNNELVCRGVLLEARCIEAPNDFSFCVFCYNVAPGITIDYSTGKSWLTE